MLINLLLVILFIPFNSFAVDINDGASATCDTGVLNTDTGPVNLRAEYEAETINLKWYNGNNQLTVPSASNSCTYDTPISLPANPTKPGYKFKGWKVFTGIPIEYIENNGTDTQYFNTGVAANNDNYNIIIDVMILQQTTTYPGIIGTTTSSNSHYNAWGLIFTDYDKFLFYTNTDNIYPRLGNGCSAPLGTNNVRYLIDFTYDRAIVNGTQYDYCSNSRGSTNNGTITLFPSSEIKFRLYSFKIYDNGTLIRDMIPVKDLSGTPCMYDKVSGQFFYNAGTGDFIAGPDL